MKDTIMSCLICLVSYNIQFMCCNVNIYVSTSNVYFTHSYMPQAAEPMKFKEVSE